MEKKPPISRRPFRLRWLGVVAVLVMLPFGLRSQPTTTSRQVVHFGVLANDAPGVCHRRWGATADYLTSEMPDYRFELVPIPFEEVLPAVRENKIDLLLTNPAQLLHLVALDLAVPIATLKGRSYGGDYAGVIFWSAQRFDIQGAKDVAGRVVAAVDQSSFGGWLMQLMEYREAGIDLPAVAKDIAFLKSHEDVVRAVLAGQADIGFCRTGVLESMAARGEIELDSVRIGTDFLPPGGRGPRHYSTRLYPEWPLLALNHVPREVTAEIRRALLDMPPNETAAQQSNTIGWGPAANYAEVRRCLRLLKVAPFDHRETEKHFSPTALHALAVVSIAGVFAVLICAILFLRLRSLRYQLDAGQEHENALGRSRSFLGAVVGSFPYPVVVIGLDYRVLLANPKAREAYGWQGVEDSIMSCHRFMRGRNYPCHETGEVCLLRKVIDSGKPEVVFTTHRYADGVEADVRVHGVPLFDPDGELHAVVEWAIDERDEPAASQTASFPVS